MSPFLTCFPLLPFGRALRAGQHSARARKSTSPHYATRCVGAKKQSAPATSYFHLVLGARFGRRHCSSNSVFERVSACLRTHRICKVRIASHRNCEQSEQYNWRSQYNCRRQYNFAKQNITHKKSTLKGVRFL